MKIELKDIIALLPSEDGFATEKTSIYTDGGIIAAIGEKPSNFTAEKTIDGKNKMAIPGLINCHTHTYMSLFRNLADDLSFEEWLFKRIDPMEGKLSGDDAYWGAMLACAEMLKSGTTAFLDMHMFPNRTLEAAEKTGMRAVISRGLVGFGRNDEGGIRRMNEAKDEIEKWRGKSRFTFMLGPHALYTTDRDYLEFVAETARDMKLPVHIHLSETRGEVKAIRDKFGISQVEYLREIGMLENKTVAAHCVHVSESDMEILAEKGVSVATNPRSNLKLGNGFAPVEKMKKAGINVCIGTDSAASNNSLNLFSEMGFVALNAKGLSENPESVPARDVLNFATRNGGKALGINSGVLKAGMNADITILDLNRPAFCPRQNLDAALVYAANGSETDTVIVDGEVVLEKGRLTMFDEAEIYANCNRIIEKLKG